MNLKKKLYFTLFCSFDIHTEDTNFIFAWHTPAHAQIHVHICTESPEHTDIHRHMHVCLHAQ